jgi:hypothetical protein
LILIPHFSKFKSYIMSFDNVMNVIKFFYCLLKKITSFQNFATNNSICFAVCFDL